MKTQNNKQEKNKSVSKQQLDEITQCIQKINQYVSEIMIMLADVTLQGREIQEVLDKKDST